jgi:NADH-quinone oxidoreductase subunit M
MTMQFIDVFPFVPLVFGLLVLAVPRGNVWIRLVPIIGTLVTFGASVGFAVGYFAFGPTSATQSIHSWIAGPWTAAYHVRFDAVSTFFVLLTTFVSVAAVWAAWSYPDARRARSYYFLLLAFETTLLGLFTAGDLLVFYVYWDLMLIPVFLLLAGYSANENARRAAWGYLIYNGAGGLVLLLGIIGLVAQTHTFEVLGLHVPLSGALGAWLFAAFALAFLIKTPAFPFHAWMPATYTQAPPPVVAMVSGVQSKAGLYGFIVFALPLFGSAAHWFAPLMLVLAVASILYGAFAALGQRDAKTLVAFSSLSHLGLVLLALFAFDFTSLPSALLMIVSHGIIAAALFILLGCVEERTGTRDIFEFGGMAAKAPVLAAFMLIAAMAALGLPGLSGFAGEFLILIGSWQTQPAMTALSLLSVVVASAYMLRLFQAIVHGPLRGAAASAGDLRPRETLILAPLLAAMFLLGAWPALISSHSTDVAAAVGVEHR